MQNLNFYQKHLDSVSRSFAFCIAKLPPQLRTYISLSYLLCRVLDTVEDSFWTDLKQKKAAFRDFDSFLLAKPSNEEIIRWTATIPDAGVSTGEKILLNDFAQLMVDFYELPISLRNKMQRSIACMSRGMNYFSEKHLHGIHLKNLVEVNQYCFFVAGIVGELLTDILSEVMAPKTFTRDVYLKSQHFGLFLQKINILKDQKEDEKNNKFFIPNKEEFIISLKNNAQQALQYILQIPNQHREFRLFCAWSLFIGLSSLNWIQNSFISNIANKIPRWMTEQLIARTENIVGDNLALQKMFNELVSQIPLQQAVLVSNTDLLIFKDLYQGPLAYEDLCQLMG